MRYKIMLDNIMRCRVKLTAMEVPGMPRSPIKKSSERATLKVPEVSKILGCGDQSVRELIARGVIPHLKFGRNLVIPKHAFFQWAGVCWRITLSKGNGAALF